MARQITSQQTVERLANVIVCSIEDGIVLCRTQQRAKPLKDIAGELQCLVTRYIEEG